MVELVYKHKKIIKFRQFFSILAHCGMGKSTKKLLIANKIKKIPEKNG